MLSPYSSAISTHAFNELYCPPQYFSGSSANQTFVQDRPTHEKSNCTPFSMKNFLLADLKTPCYTPWLKYFDLFIGYIFGAQTPSDSIVDLADRNFRPFSALESKENEKIEKRYFGLPTVLITMGIRPHNNTFESEPRKPEPASPRIPYLFYWPPFSASLDAERQPTVCKKWVLYTWLGTSMAPVITLQMSNGPINGCYLFEEQLKCIDKHIYKVFDSYNHSMTFANFSTPFLKKGVVTILSQLIPKNLTLDYEANYQMTDESFALLAKSLENTATCEKEYYVNNTAWTGVVFGAIVVIPITLCAVVARRKLCKKGLDVARISGEPNYGSMDTGVALDEVITKS